MDMPLADKYPISMKLLESLPLVITLKIFSFIAFSDNSNDGMPNQQITLKVAQINLMVQ